MDILIGLDIGDVRVGIAKADSHGIVITPIKTVKREQLFKELRDLMIDFNVSKFVVGLPKNMDGTIGDQAIKTKNYAQEIAIEFPEIEIVFEDERLTSEAAAEILKGKGMKINEKNRDMIDMYAAAVILEQHLAK